MLPNDIKGTPFLVEDAFKNVCQLIWTALRRGQFIDETVGAAIGDGEPSIRST